MLEADRHMCRADVFNANESYRRNGLKGSRQLNSTMERLMQHTFNAAIPRYASWEIDRETPERAINVPPMPRVPESSLSKQYPGDPENW